MDIEVRIRGLMMDPATNMPIVVLKDVASETVMPIWVGIFEANAIAIEIEKMAAPRPMTHDLTRNLIHHLNSQLERVVITELMQTARLNTTGPPEGPTAEQLRGWLEGLNDEDLGRYKM